MFSAIPYLLAQAPEGEESSVMWMVVIGICVVIGLMLFVFLIVAAAYGKIWFQAFMSRADVSMLSLIGMGFRQVKPSVIVTLV